MSLATTASVLNIILEVWQSICISVETISIVYMGWDNLSYGRHYSGTENACKVACEHNHYHISAERCPYSVA